MKLYIKPGACSLSPHIALKEAGIACDLVKVDLATKKTEDGGDYLAVNPKGQVPALRLDDGGLITEGPVIVQYLADQRPDSGLIPPPGTLARYRVLEWLNFVGTELHKSFSPLFRPTTPDAYKSIAKELLAARLAHLDGVLADRPYLAGEAFTVADGYCFTVLRWTKPVGIELGQWPNLTGYFSRVAARPGVQAALEEEGLA